MAPKPLTSEAVRRINEMIPRHTDEHYNYQNLESLLCALSGERPEISYRQEQVPIDQERFNWLSSNIRACTATHSVLEIGGNLGYVCLRLARELGVRATCLEPIEDYVRISNFIAQETGLAHLYQARAALVVWDSLDSLPSADVVIHLNVLHHAGRVFDCDLVRRLGGWRSYARSYLEKLARKGRYLFFQTGNTWPGERLFSNAEAPDFLVELLTESGWRVLDIGTCDHLPALRISNHVPTNRDAIPRVWCRRNPITDLVDYHQEGRWVASFPTGLAQRPLLFCETRQ